MAPKKNECHAQFLFLSQIINTVRVLNASERKDSTMLIGLIAHLSAHTFLDPLKLSTSIRNTLAHHSLISAVYSLSISLLKMKVIMDEWRKGLLFYPYL